MLDDCTPYERLGLALGWLGFLIALATIVYLRARYREARSRILEEVAAERAKVEADRGRALRLLVLSRLRQERRAPGPRSVVAARPGRRPGAFHG